MTAWRKSKIRFAVLATVVLLGLPAATTHAATLMNLWAFISYSIDVDGVGTHLPDGSVIYMIASGDDIVDPLDPVGAGGTNYIASATTGDDQIVATIRVGDGVGTDTGRFFWSGIINRYTNMYIRYFASSNTPVVGYTNWGESSMHTVQQLFGEMYMINFAPTSNLYATNKDNFIVIPEPGTFGLYVMACGLIAVLRRRWRKADRGVDA